MPAHPIIDGKKVCIKCKAKKDISNFAKQKNCKEGVRPNCKQCLSIRSKNFYLQHAEKIKAKAKEYGQTEYRKKYCRERAKVKLKEKRDREASRPRPNLCECCQDKPGRQGIVWDHNHQTGKFRGWLCNRCNRVLGLCKDSIVIFKRLAEYLEEYG